MTENRLEQRFYAALDRYGLVGYEKQPRSVAGAPDAFFRHVRPRPVAVWVDGCAWHACPAHFRPGRAGDPDNAHRLSSEGAAKVRLSDKRIRSALAASGFNVLAFWEHDCADMDKVARQVAAAVKGAA